MSQPPETDAKPKPGLGFRVLQVSVWLMGALLIVGLVGLGFALTWRSQQDPAQLGQVVSADPLASAMASGFTGYQGATLPIPAGSRIADMEFSGTLVILHLRWADGTPGGLMWFYDFRTKRVVAELRVP